ncbi:Flp pilus assembly protein TadG [Marmoricola sp. OAE513]|uniref:TadE/TadG family type IV pilus assembly protein n=1 Tax=Marmoricola sp. OAE513 TaxID=2817894 RepID=UPI001AE5982A
MPHGSEKQRRSRDQRGSAALEFALIVPILVMVVFGIVDFGWAINRDTAVNNAAREGAREGSLNPDSASVVAVVRRSLSAVEPVGTTPSKIAVSVTCRKPDNSVCTNFATDAVSGGTVVVKVTLSHSWITPVGSTFGNGILLSKTVEMRIE